MRNRFRNSLNRQSALGGIVYSAGVRLGFLDHLVKPISMADSHALARTAIVPTPDTPIPPGKNAIWCPSFQLAWTHAVTDVIHAPIRLSASQQVADRLNHAPLTEADLPPGSCFAKAGMVKDGIVQQINNGMAQQFPHWPVPPFTFETPDDIIAYAYLEASAKLLIPLDALPAPLTFSDADRQTTRLTAFGATTRTKVAVKQFVHISYISDDGQHFIAQIHTHGVQIVLACLPRPRTLSEILTESQRLIEEAQAGNLHEFFKCRKEDTVTIPIMNWQVTHHFTELEGQRVMNAGYEDGQLANAIQSMRFTLDRNGAMLQSEAKMLISRGFSSEPPPPPCHLRFDRPFLVYLQPTKKGMSPYFAMWVDNAELLDRW